MIYMKKLIAIAVVFVLAVGVAFAADVGAEVIGKLVPLKGDSVDGSTVNVEGPFRRVRFQAEGQNDDGNFGGWLRFESGWDGNGGTSGGTVQAWGLAWWKPLDILKVQFGANPDGHFGIDGVTRWAFYQVGGDVDVAHEGWAFGESFYAGDGRPGAFLTLTPIEQLAINVSIPLTDGWGGEAKTVYRKLNAQVVYDIASIGKVGLTYAGDVNEDADSASKLWAYFGLSAIENLGIDLGIGYYIPVKDDATDTTWKKPVALGLGINFNSGALGIKARVQGQFGGSTKIASVTIKDNTTVTADLLPSFAINDKVSALLDTGLVFDKAEGSDAQVGWHIMPYVSVKANAWAPNLYAGFRFESEGKAPGGPDAVINWSEVGWHIMPYVAVKANAWAPNLYAGFRFESEGKDPGGPDAVINWSVPIGLWFAF